MTTMNLYSKEQVDTKLTTKANSSDLATVATTGAYSDLSGTPNLATVATSGSYTDLSDKPTIPPAVTVDSVLDSVSENPVQNKVINTALGTKADTSSLATVATTGSYTDLSNKPSIPSVAQDVGAIGTSALVTSVSSSSTDAQVPSAKAVYTTINSYVPANMATTTQVNAKQDKLYNAQITVPTTGGAVTVSGMTATATVWVAPDPVSFDVYTTAGCYCSAQASNSLTFTVSKTASANMTVNVAWTEVA